MAMIECPECEGSCSDTAKACPHCGFDFVAQQAAAARTLVAMEREENEEEMGGCLQLVFWLIIGAVVIKIIVEALTGR